jgi:hypothetical protein
VDRLHPPPENATVIISCTWDEGVPPQPAHLKRDGVELVTSPQRYADLLTSQYDVTAQQRHVDHVIDHVQCLDSGNVTCEVFGADVNLSYWLFVRCELSELKILIVLLGYCQISPPVMSSQSSSCSQ